MVMTFPEYCWALAALLKANRLAAISLQMNFIAVMEMSSIGSSLKRQETGKSNLSFFWRARPRATL
jgi:hypothetical protein